MKLALHILGATLYASVWIAALFIGLVSLVLTGCGGNAHATPAKPMIIIHSKPAPPPAEEAPERDAPLPVVLRDVLAPPKAAVKIDANTYRACTCGDVCTCANCPSDCNLVARGDCPGGVCLMPQRSVLTRSTANHAQVASGDCDSGACGVAGTVKGVAKRAAKVATAPARFIVRRIFRR